MKMNRRGALRRMLGLGAGVTSAAVVPAAFIFDQEGEVYEPAFEPDEVGADRYADLHFSKMVPSKPRPYVADQGFNIGPAMEPSGDEVDINWSKDGHLWALLKKDGKVVNQRKLI